MLQFALALRKTVAREVVKIREVDLDYAVEESTGVHGFDLMFGSVVTRVIIETTVLGREIREFCLRKGWQVHDLDLLVIDAKNQPKVYKAGKIAELRISPSMFVRELQWQRKAGEKG